jgi:HK97 family phage portal protein
MLIDKEGTINQVQAQALKDNFRKQYQGTNNAGDVIVSSKDLSWVNFGLSAADLSLIEQYNGTVKDLCNIYNIPVQLLNNTDSSTYNNMKEAKKAMYQNAVIPELIKIRDELNRWLVPQFGANLYLDFDFTMISEMQEEVDKLVSQLASAWWITPNEKRDAMNYGKDEVNAYMNDYFIPTSLAPQNVTIDALENPKALDIDYDLK